LNIATDNYAHTLSLKTFIITFFANIWINIGVVPFAESFGLTQESFASFINTLHVEENTFVGGVPRLYNVLELVYFHEDYAKNYFQMLLVVVSFILIFHRKQKQVKPFRVRLGEELFYPFMVLLAWCMFSFSYAWQPFITRIQTPLFALSAPVFALAFANKSAKTKNRILIFLGCFALLPLAINSSRPLYTVSPLTAQRSIWNSSREDLLFSNRAYVQEEYNGAAAVIAEIKPKKLGIIKRDGAWEYPMWWLLRVKYGGYVPAITHLEAGAVVPDDVDALLLIEAGDLPSGADNVIHFTSSPIVMRRNGSGSWDVVYASGEVSVIPKPAP
jgi:hypothetical protein